MSSSHGLGRTQSKSDRYPSGDYIYGPPSGGNIYGPPAGGNHYGPPAGGNIYGPPAGVKSYDSLAGGDPELWKLFSDVDSDKSGSISISELQSALMNGTQ